MTMYERWAELIGAAREIAGAFPAKTSALFKIDLERTSGLVYTVACGDDRAPRGVDSYQAWRQDGARMDELIVGARAWMADRGFGAAGDDAWRRIAETVERLRAKCPLKSVSMLYVAGGEPPVFELMVSGGSHGRTGFRETNTDAEALTRRFGEWLSGGSSALGGARR